MRVVHVGTSVPILNLEFVDIGLARLDRRLRDKGHPVLIVRDIETVPVNRGTLREFVGDIEAALVAGDGLVLDALLGSGTSLLAAHETGRRAARIELDPRYVDLAITRFTDATGVHFTNQDGQSFEEAKAARIHGDK